ncbi:hypothetical protein L227DRAFT_611790 [Lentinus tigrinus ALCF2SS1-6]|uniref:Uncharacterized protein n=1 Tax=Lentinus tigrinus ALCF2SS1-6 TaxID=1328759 RepID=A0A5C2S913_9APHY|nr:hypothetical protein L227DRAFT_611790 [Lentinus tigrinus ALCF2SS1-6]
MASFLAGQGLLGWEAGGLWSTLLDAPALAPPSTISLAETPAVSHGQVLAKLPPAKWSGRVVRHCSLLATGSVRKGVIFGHFKHLFTPRSPSDIGAHADDTTVFAPTSIGSLSEPPGRREGHQGLQNARVPEGRGAAGGVGVVLRGAGSRGGSVDIVHSQGTILTTTGDLHERRDEQLWEPTCTDGWPALPLSQHPLTPSARLMSHGPPHCVTLRPARHDTRGTPLVQNLCRRKVFWDIGKEFDTPSFIAVLSLFVSVMHLP